MCTFAVILVVWSMFPYENGVSLNLFTTSSLQRFISYNSDNIVQTVIIIGDMCILWQNHALNVFYAEFIIISIVLPLHLCPVLPFPCLHT